MRIAELEATHQTPRLQIEFIFAELSNAHTDPAGLHSAETWTRTLLEGWQDFTLVPAAGC